MRFAAQRDYRNLVWRIVAEHAFQQFVPRDGTVVDVGCGWGEFINNIMAEKKFAIDLNPDAAQRVNADVELIQQDCSEPWPVADASVDCVFTSNFFEHLRSKDALEATLSEAFRCLRSGGRIVCMGPNIRFLPGEYWDFWDHYVPLTDRSLSEVLRLTGFVIERQVPRFLPYRMSGRREAPGFAVRLYLMLPVFWRLFGRQFLVVGLKPPESAA